LDEKAPSPIKWILLGCGGLLLVGLLGAGGCGVAIYFANKNADEIAKTGAEYLRTEPRVVKALGTIRKAERELVGWQVNIKNDRGDAYFRYTVEAANGNALAEVWLTREPGTGWRALGAAVRPSLEQSSAKFKVFHVGTPGVSPSDRTHLSD